MAPSPETASKSKNELASLMRPSASISARPALPLAREVVKASVAVVIPCRWRNDDGAPGDAVLKVLKPHVKERLGDSDVFVDRDFGRNLGQRGQFKNAGLEDQAHQNFQPGDGPVGGKSLGDGGIEPRAMGDHAFHKDGKKIRIGRRQDGESLVFAIGLRTLA